MSYLDKSNRNWGMLIATMLAVPLGMAWTAVSLIGGSLVCADQAAHCSGVVWPLVCGIAIIAAGAMILAGLINWIVSVISHDR
jgi:hypothetical protein